MHHCTTVALDLLSLVAHVRTSLHYIVAVILVTSRFL